MKSNIKGQSVERIQLRSLLKKYFPVELLIKLDEISCAYDIDNNSKTSEIIELLNEYKVPFTPLGNGTNRYGILIDGFAIKIALDRMGKIDNQREFKYSKFLYPKVVKVYECFPTGLIAAFEYVTILSLSEFYERQEEMREILSEIAPYFLIGDIGISTVNYVNWGIRPDGSLVILDFAYIYSLSYRGFTCTCEDEGMLQFDNDYNYLICPFCGKKWTFADIRRRISKQDEINEIGDIRECGYVLSHHEEFKPVDLEKSPYLKKNNNKKKKKKHRNSIKEHEKDQWDFTVEDQEEALRSLNKLLYENGGFHNGKKEKHN